MGKQIKGYNAEFTDGISGKDPRMFIMIYYGPNSGCEGGYFNGFGRIWRWI
jgi:hypothetical protein